MYYPDLCKALGFGFRANKSVAVRTGTLQAGLAQVDWSLTGPAPAALSSLWELLVGSGLTPDEHRVSSALAQLS